MTAGPYYGAAVRLARAALDGAGRAPASVLARLHTTEASAHAIAGDRQACAGALAKAGRVRHRLAELARTLAPRRSVASGAEFLEEHRSALASAA